MTDFGQDIFNPLTSSKILTLGTDAKPNAIKLAWRLLRCEGGKTKFKCSNQFDTSLAKPYLWHTPENEVAELKEAKESFDK